MRGADVDTGRPRARTVYAVTARMFREHPGNVVGTAALVLVPVAIVDTLGLLDLGSGVTARRSTRSQCSSRSSRVG
jgi:hypothetical protein